MTYEMGDPNEGMASILLRTRERQLKWFCIFLGDFNAIISAENADDEYFCLIIYWCILLELGISNDLSVNENRGQVATFQTSAGYDHLPKTGAIVV